MVWPADHPLPEPPMIQPHRRELLRGVQPAVDPAELPDNIIAGIRSCMEGDVRTEDAVDAWKAITAPDPG